MIIVQTKIPDVVVENINQSKQRLANDIIKNVFPLFDEIHESKMTELKNLQNELQEKKDLVNKNKEHLQFLMNEYNKKKKVKKLISRISKLVSSGLVFDGNLKHETVILLKVIDSLSEEKIEYHLSETLKIINKRFSRL